MKIAYLGQMADVATENGISKKIRSQTTHWRHLGHDVRYFSLVPTEAIWSGLAELPVELMARGNAMSRIFRSFRIARKIRDWKPDVIYFRYAYHSPGLSALFRQIPTVAEINSDDLTEYPITLSPAKVLYHRLTRRRVLRPVAGFVAVTRELAGRISSFGAPVEVIANGIDLDQFTPVPTAAGESLRLVFLGSAGTPWHGLQRAGEIARLVPDAIFDIVGCTESDWQAAAAEIAPPGNMHFHGPLARSAYEPLLQKATAAIGTLALFQKKMNEACPLKVREYLAMGLPVIAGYHDTDIGHGTDYFLELPNNSEPLATRRDEIVAWLRSWQTRRVSRESVAHLDNSLKERQRLAFIQKVARPATQPR